MHNSHAEHTLKFSQTLLLHSSCQREEARLQLETAIEEAKCKISNYMLSLGDSAWVIFSPVEWAWREPQRNSDPLNRWNYLSYRFFATGRAYAMHRYDIHQRAACLRKLGLSPPIKRHSQHRSVPKRKRGKKYVSRLQNQG